MSTVNGQEFQQGLMNFDALGTGSRFSFTTFRSLEFEDMVEKEAVGDYQGQQISYVIKPQKTSASTKILTSELVTFFAWLRAEADRLSQQVNRPIEPGQVAFDVTVMCGPTLNNLTYKRRLKTVLVQKDKFSSSDDQKALETELPLFVLKITDENGREFMGWKKR